MRAWSRAQRRICGLALLVCASAAGAQAPQDPPRALLVEAELLGGYTAVPLNSWANTVPTTSDQASYGVNVRAFFFFISRTRVGVELGNRHFFSWEQRRQIGSTLTTTRHRVAGFRFALVAQPCDGSRIDCDAGYGFHFLGKDVLPGAHFGMNYLLVNSKRFKLPLGARVDFIVSDRSVALPMALKTGFTLKM